MPLVRHSRNPILIRTDIPPIYPGLIDVSSVFNPGAVLKDGKIILLLRVQNRGRETFLLKAESENGVDFKIDAKPVIFAGIEKIPFKVYHVYDPRITFLDGIYYIMFAMDTDMDSRLGLAKTVDFENYEFIDIVSTNDNRNGVLFPEKIGGKYYRFDRPNKALSTGNPVSGARIVLSVSDNLKDWTEVAPVMDGRFHYWDELIGAGPPPIKTKHGWLLVYHGVATHFASSHIYQAGAALFDLADPSKLLARTRYNILEPRELYELTGQVPNVVFPSGMIAMQTEEYGFASGDSELYIYYGAADTSVCLAVTTVKSLIEDCYAGSK